MKISHGKIIRKARVAQGFAQMVVGHAIGRSQFWISCVESGKITIDQATADKILRAIERLGALKKPPSRDPAFEDLRLPSRVEAANACR